MLSQVLRFTLPPLTTVSSSAFLTLLRVAAAAGASKQYYGYTTASKSPLPRKRHEVCWVIHWADNADRNNVIAEMNKISTQDATSLLFRFTDAQLVDLDNALQAPICEFAHVRLSDDTTLSDSALQTSMHKTYADTFKLVGFTGGYWAYALNTNETSGVPTAAESGEWVPEGERRLGVYVLGWESIELHEDAAKTPEFAEEIIKLAPHFGPGTGAWYAKLRQYE
ncbi:hypothetical protein B0T25DRAFT_536995 [Lasiosphaeria hispida]|uniref:Uncharacterized protein n=1 Tax=Lasiosphaeria hispida TaxID=260671 RepID=A0AAJ0MFL3_9PEZI|nr:hypothetical protein B0T25DRAFT_536995 [Lasiosphaeria hispida]